MRRILDHDSPQMTAHYARLHDTTVRRHWEAARKVDIAGALVAIAPTSDRASRMSPISAMPTAKRSRLESLPGWPCTLRVQERRYPMR